MDGWLAIVGVLVVATFTPGPNNFIVMAVGSQSSWRHTVPVIAAVIAGGLVLLNLVWLGIGSISAMSSVTTSVLALGCIYLGLMGVRMIASADDRHTAPSLPRTTLGVAAFQLANPKAWLLMATMTASAGRIESGVAAWAILMAIFAGVSLLGLTLWTSLGSWLSRLLDKPEHGRWILRIMGAMLVVSSGLLLIGPVKTT